MDDFSLESHLKALTEACQAAIPTLLVVWGVA